MTDVYVYYFKRIRGRAGKNVLSKRRATLEAIQAIGDPVMESQVVVDHSEVDANGFLIGGADDESHPLQELWAQIRSLKLRAESRDREALTLDESTEGRRKYMLNLESRELRKQAQQLMNQRVAFLAGDPGRWSAPQAFEQFGSSLTTESTRPLALATIRG